MSIGGDDDGPKLLVWLRGEVKTPPFTLPARHEVGNLLRRLQEGLSLGMPHSRPMPSIGRNCHELRVRDAGHNWRVLYRVLPHAIEIGDVFAKTTRKTPKAVIAACKARFARADAARRAANERERNP
jgi:phage-related protein